MKYLVRSPLYLAVGLGLLLLIAPGRDDGDSFGHAIIKLGGGLSFVIAVGFLLVLASLDRFALLVQSKDSPHSEDRPQPLRSEPRTK